MADRRRAQNPPQALLRFIPGRLGRPGPTFARFGATSATSSGETAGLYGQVTARRGSAKGRTASKYCGFQWKTRDFQEAPRTALGRRNCAFGRCLAVLLGLRRRSHERLFGLGWPLLAFSGGSRATFRGRLAPFWSSRGAFRRPSGLSSAPPATFEPLRAMSRPFFGAFSGPCWHHVNALDTVKE